MTGRELSRFQSRVDPEPNSGCWIWVGGRTKKGYGRIQVDWKRKEAHVVSYKHFVGAIPPGLQLDHLCRLPCCVNPGHLEAVTCRVNLLRGATVAATNAAKTTCPHGHPYSHTDVSGGRRCRPCELRAERAYRDRRRARVVA
jgi:hypothetical protein